MPNVIILISGIFLGIVGFYLFYKFLSKKKLLTPADCNSRDAEDFLKKRGFQIVEKKRQSSVVVYVNGKGHLNTEAADFIVERDRKRYVVKVVNEIGVDPTEPAMRRKLIEFSKLFPGLEILLLNLNGATGGLSKNCVLLSDCAIKKRNSILLRPITIYKIYR